MDIPEIIAGRFRIEGEIGNGGMGTVYRAMQLGLEREVAVKVLRGEFATDSEMTNRFMREARTMAKMRHQHAAMIFDAGTLPDGRHFIVMEYVEGRTLAEVLLEDGRFTFARAAQVTNDVCEVLEEAHRLGIVHRDLKPSNIMLSNNGIRVLDFGVAKVLASASDSTLSHATTQSGVIVGTPRYMSPEQCLGHQVEPRSDLYSLGVVLFEMLAGQPPFTGQLASAVLVKQATAPPPALDGMRKDVPRALAALVKSMLAKRPTDRPADAATVRRLLTRALESSQHPPAIVEPLAATIAALERGRTVAFQMLIPFLILAGLGALLFALATSSQSAPPLDQTSANELAHSAPLNTGALQPLPVIPIPISLRNALRSVAPDETGGLSYGPDPVMLRAGNTSEIAFLQRSRATGATQLFSMRRTWGQYRLNKYAVVDRTNGSTSDWRLQRLDINRDGYDELLCVRSLQPGVSTGSERAVLYSPRLGELYSVTSTRGSTEAPILVWSLNCARRRAGPYKAALQQALNLSHQR